MIETPSRSHHLLFFMVQVFEIQFDGQFLAFISSPDRPPLSFLWRRENSGSLQPIGDDAR